jgi:hypothetical protein
MILKPRGFEKNKFMLCRMVSLCRAVKAAEQAVEIGADRSYGKT